MLGEARRTVGMQDRTWEAMNKVAWALSLGATLEDAAAEAGVSTETVKRWRQKYYAYAELVGRMLDANKTRRRETHVKKASQKKQDAGLVLNKAVGDGRPDRGRLKDFRMAYFGRPTPEHHEFAVEALEDQTNLTVFILGPTGMGKDTLAGDYVAWEVAPDERGKRIAWFMESTDFSARRMQRLERYLVDPAVYEHVPAKTPGGQKPTRSLIEDYGPFRWAKGMVHPDGTPVERTQWTNNTMFFVRVAAPEQDPNLWATGLNGATYGSRIDVAVVSDAFTLENQAQPAPRRSGLTFIEGTLDTRLDESGRLVVIGTMLPIENNYEVLMEKYTEGARVVQTKENPCSTYTKYSNGTAVVIVKAIVVDPDTGEERSYWPERFPLDDEYHYKGKVYRADTLSDERIMQVVEGGGRLVRGLRTRRARNPAMFAAMFMQTRDRESGGDFTDATFEACQDHERSFGYLLPHEIGVLGIDPAKRYGAAWVLLAVDRREQTVTLADYFFGTNLGYTGIKQRLIIEPLSRFSPTWMLYEPNQHGAILSDPLIAEAIRDFGVSLDTPHTGKERGDPEVGVASIAAYMRGKQFLIPYATVEDRNRFEQVKEHFKAFDAGLNRPKPGTPRHVPDDIALATWVAWRKALVLMLGRAGLRRGIRAPVPAGLRRKYDRMVKRVKPERDPERQRAEHHSALDGLEAFDRS